MQRKRDCRGVWDFFDADGQGAAEVGRGKRWLWPSMVQAGGYLLAKEPAKISALEVITAIDGPVLITSCVTSHGNCDATDRCSIKEPLQRVNESILGVLRHGDHRAVERG